MKNQINYSAEVGKSKATYQSVIYKSALGEQEIMTLYDKTLQKWPVPYAAQTIKTRHGDTFVIISGDKEAPPLVLLHGSASNALSWMGEVAQYSKYFYVFAVDIIGEPGKSAPNRPSWEGEGFTEWMEDVLKGLGLSKVLLLGISQGGWTALKFATAHPEYIEKLVLLTPAGVVPTKNSFILRAILFSMLGKWGAERLNRLVFGKQALDPLALKFMNIIMTHFKPRIEKEYIFSDEQLKHLQIPVLLVGGERDVIRSVRRIAKRLEKLIADLVTLIILESGHVVINVADQIIPFLLAKKYRS